MADIFLDLPEEMFSQYEEYARLIGITTETLLRQTIEKNALTLPSYSDIDLGTLDDEPIVKAAQIEMEYRRLGYECGWRFLTCPRDHMKQSKLLLVGLNPGGSRHDPMGSWSQECGSAYRVESWDNKPIGKSRLQLQMQAMFRLLGLNDEDVFSAQFVPFRSPSWKALKHKAEAIRFAEKLWEWLLPQVSFERVVVMGKNDAAKAMAWLLKASLETSLPVGWGKQTADRYRLPDGRLLIALPHPSRFGIFDRGKSLADVQKLFFE